VTEQQWQEVLKIVRGEKTESPQVGFIIDSPWLPGWFGISTLDYYTSDELWLKANLKAINTFPDVIFLPGFWSEYGMCTEPSAFGSKCIWEEQNLPHAEKIISSIDQIADLQIPNVKTDGLLPFIINRLKNTQAQILQNGHEIKFAISRGPMNIASFLMGTTEFLLETVLHPEEIHKLLEKITKFTTDWLTYQKECFPTIKGMLVLDDIVGFVGKDDFLNFGYPYLETIYNSFEASVNLFHNDAKGLVCAPFLEKLNINMFNFSHEHPLSEMRQLVGENVALLGNIPPRDVLAQGSIADVENCVNETKKSIENHNGILWSCGGGMPQDVSTENIQTFVKSVRSRR
jgi:uroporphyrinogen-III decarboxylase